ncbi:MAG TPA: ATP-binding protein [Terriglobales bacterium]|nr:ATP-binding protein [Terriglobales bacterium]
MSFQRKLLAVLVTTVFLSVGAVTLIVSVMTRRVFEQSDRERTAALVAQFRRDFERRGEDLARRIQAIAASEASTRMAVALEHGAPDYGSYFSEAKNIAESQQLDFLEFVDNQGTVISSAQSPARFGYKESISLANPPQQAFLYEEDLPEGTALGLFAIRKTENGDKTLYVIGGRRLDENFLASLELPTGMRAMLYENVGPNSQPILFDSEGSATSPEQLFSLIDEIRKEPGEKDALIHWSSNAADDEMVHGIPLTGRENRLLGVLLVGNSRREYVALRQHIRTAALLAGSAGIVLAILFSSWAAARVTRPVAQLAEAAKEVAAGDWNARVPVASADELGALAESFNHMTAELLGQRERLVQAERVAAWRELARRLAHELKNPLFPLQLTVENLVRARAQGPQQFDEVFRESAATLLAEIANLKQIVSRFSEFSKMPQPQIQRTNLNDIAQNVMRLFQPQLQQHARVAIECKLDLAANMAPIAADPELFHQAISNLVKNAIEAMPDGGVLTLRTLQNDSGTMLEVSDTGIGLTSQERAHLFTPYYTSKAQGTGLGLAIVQSVVTDHGGSITAQNEPGRGTTFRIELPRNPEKLTAEEHPRANSQYTS